MKYSILILLLASVLLFGCVTPGDDVQRSQPVQNKDYDPPIKNNKLEQKNVVPQSQEIPTEQPEQEQKNQTQERQMKNLSNQQQADIQEDPEKKGCNGTGPVTFTFSPSRVDSIGFIEPMGLISGSHVTPIDHGYFKPKNWKPSEVESLTVSDLTNVYVPADGVITSIGRMPTFFSNKNSKFEDYRIR